MDKLTLKGINFYGYHGTTAAERKKGREFQADVAVFCDLRKAGKSDKLADAVDYKKIYDIVLRVQSVRKYHLIEALAEKIAFALLEEFGTVNEVSVRVRKPGPPVGGPVDYAEAEITRKKQLHR